MKSNYAGSIVYVDRLEKKYLGYLHELFCYSTNTIGSKSSFSVIVTCTNVMSHIVSESCEFLHLYQHQINNWFIANGGKEISPVEKPLDTINHMRL